MIDFFESKGKSIMVIDSEAVKQEDLDKVDWDTAKYNDHVADCRIYHVAPDRETFTLLVREENE